ncbi:hypothetical protein [Sphaerochaeta pleomorpha]|nr:hypothetical protein [Sphaerochaeta pleomorpha]
MVSLVTIPVFAQLVYSTESSIDISYGYGYYSYYSGYGSLGSLVGTLSYDGNGTEPSSLNFSGSALNNNGVTFTFLKNDGTTYTRTIDAVCYVTYTRDFGSQQIIMASSSRTYNLTRINWNYPVKFYLFFNNSDLERIFYNAPGKLVYVSTNTFFNPQEYYSPIETISNLGTTTQPIPLLGGGLLGAGGINSLPATDLYYDFSSTAIPEYSISFTANDVSINDLTDAIDNPIHITDLKLEILNYDDVYMGQTNIQVKFFQSGHASFEFINNAGKTIPFTLLANGITIIPNIKFFPWVKPLIENNLAAIGFSVTQADYDQAEMGDYNATITVELITGV